MLKTFLVKLAPSTPIMLAGGEVLVSNPVEVRVEAEYFRVDAGGTLTFRNSGRGNQYPEAVRVFAAGVWTEVEPYHGS